MPEPAAPFAVDLATAACALVPAQPAGTRMLGLRADRPAGNPRVARLSGALPKGAGIDAPDTAAVACDSDAAPLLAAGAQARAGS